MTQDKIKRRFSIKPVARGFTLVEILIVSGLLATIGTIIVLTLFTTIRASKKSDALISLKQSGNAVVSQVSKGIRYAARLDPSTTCDSVTPLTSVTVTSISDNATTKYACVGGSNPTIASNGASLLDTNAAAVSGCSFYCSETGGTPPVIKFNFTLTTQGTSATDSSASIPFSTSVIMRNAGE